MGPLKVLCLALVLGAVTAREHWKEEVLKKENEHRADHSSPPLKYNEVLEKGAQEWAEHLADNCGDMKHAPSDPQESPSLFSINNEQQGENIYKYMAAGNPLNYEEHTDSGALSSADSWYREINSYPWGDFDGKDNPTMIFHFTQMVWEGTKEVGYGRATCNSTYHGHDPTVPDGSPQIKVYTVARYYPMGNHIGAFKQNVHPKQ